MTNREVAKIFNTLGKVMELHGESHFKTRSYTNAYLTIRKITEPVTEMDISTLQSIQGIGKAISEKIVELKETGELRTLNKYLDITPVGIVDMLNIKGFGPKKIKTVWEGLGIESPGELLYACEENRLIDLKGFGAKTQNTVMQQLKYFLESKGKFLFGKILPDALDILDHLQTMRPNDIIDFCGDLDRKMPIINELTFLVTCDEETFSDQILTFAPFSFEEEKLTYNGIPFNIEYTDETMFASVKFQKSCSEQFLEQVIESFGEIDNIYEEEEVFETLDIAFIPSECRENPIILDRAAAGELSLISDQDIKGIIHNHSTYSDGLHSLSEMAEATKAKGFEYLVISDHSQAAFYANGLQEERVQQQWTEIDELNAQWSDFRIFKGIESDILNDGSLDYTNDILEGFDCVIASIHSNLKMDLNKAMQRLIRAVENPYTKILGHPTGRLLLSREGYPIDHEKLIDACVANNVVIEINANPLRLDIDWRWIDYIIKKDGMVSINPDAHSIDGIDDVRYGVIAARKGGLMPEYCLNTFDLEAFKAWI